jgi:hypothetical protein
MDNETFDEKIIKKNGMQEMLKIQTKRKAMAKNSNTKVQYYKKMKIVQQILRKQKTETFNHTKDKILI